MVKCNRYKRNVANLYEQVLTSTCWWRPHSSGKASWRLQHNAADAANLYQQVLADPKASG